MAPISIVEHLVLLKVRASTDPSRADAMVSGQRSLSSLDIVPYLSSGYIRRCRPTAHFTNLLHIRFRSKSDLQDYALRPSHLEVIRQHSPILEDIMAVDWVADLDGEGANPSPGSALRFLIARPRDGTPAAEIVEAVDGIAAPSKVTCGVNISPERAKGYDVCLLLGFSGPEEMEGAAGEEQTAAIEEKIRDLAESVFVVDFVVPPDSGPGLM